MDRGVADRLARGGQGGSPLPRAERVFFEPRLGHDFSGVRVHSGPEAAQLTRSLGARAFAHGDALYFGAGQYAPGSAEGRRLIAHELTHVVQQRGGVRQIQLAPAEVAAPPDPIQKLKNQLKAAYGFADVVDGDAKWTAAELQQVIAALALLPIEDKPALAGVVLKRVASLEENVGGRFDSDVRLKYPEPTNKPAADASAVDQATEPDLPTLVNENILNLTNKGFQEGAPGSYTTILHEVAHAVESFKLHKIAHEANVATLGAATLQRDAITARREFKTAEAAKNALVNPYNAALQKLKDAAISGDAARTATAKAEFDTIEKAYAAKKAVHDDRLTVSDAALVKANAATTAANDKQELVKTELIPPTRLDDLKDDVQLWESAHDGAMKDAGGVVAKLPSKAKIEAQQYVASVKLVSQAIKTLASQTPDPKLEVKDVDKKIAYVNEMITKRDQQRSALAELNSANPVLAAFATVEATQKSWFDAVKAYSLAHQRTAVVQRFVDFVDEHGIEPITQYARDEWPQKPGEFFAEAYSWFLAKPLELKALSPKLHGWFAEKKYR